MTANSLNTSSTTDLAYAERASSGVNDVTRERWITRSSIGLLAVVAAGVLVFFAFDALPFMDLPAHAGLMALRHRIAESPFEQSLYVVAPHVGPYSLFRGIGELLLHVTTPLGAVRVLGTLPIVATPAAMLFARLRLHGDRSSTYGHFAVVLSFGLMTVFGFASYLLGAAVALVALTLWLELLIGVDRGAPFLRKETLVVAAIAPIVFLAHGHAFLIYCFCAFVASIATGNRVRRVLHLVAMGPAVMLAGYSVLLDRVTAAGAVAQHPEMAPLFQGPADKLSLLFTPTLTTRLGVDLGVGIALWGLVIAGTIATLRHLRATRTETVNAATCVNAATAANSHATALFACAAGLLVVFLVMPHEVGWFGFVDGRFVPMAMLLAFVAIRREALSPRLASTFHIAAPMLSCVAVAWMWFASVGFQREAQGYREVFAAVPAQARLLNLPIDPDSDIFAGHPFVHYDKLIMISRPIVPSDVWFHQGTGIYPRPGNPVLALPADYKSSTIRHITWEHFRLTDWDYALVRTRPNASAPATPKELGLVMHQGGWWLYRSNVAVPQLPPSQPAAE
ncbi:MAG: hypothetical protein JWM74_4662 [Myxococcaceae bacterium]|nr:hypothetical protein [Myxococcaceae bacterium]